MIEVGEYVRTKKGNFGKVLDITNVTGQKRKKYLIKWNISKAYYITATTIVKHSKNLIDLIEVGDYVNGKEICLKDEKENAVVWGFQLKDEQRIFYLYEQDIKSIVTKESFKNAEYRVETDDRGDER